MDIQTNLEKRPATVYQDPPQVKCFMVKFIGFIAAYCRGVQGDGSRGAGSNLDFNLLPAFG